MPEQNNEEEIDLAEYFFVLLKHWKKIVTIVIISVFLTSLFSLTQPFKYESTAVFFPLDLINTKETTDGFKPKVNIEDLIISILKSREMADQIIKELDLMSVWKTKFLFETRDILSGLTKISTEKSGIVKLTVITKNPELSEKIANAYVNGLDEFNKRLQISANVSIIQTIDHAVSPETRMPRGTVKKVLFSFIVSSFFSIFLVFTIEWAKKIDFQNKLKLLSKR